MVRNVSSHRKSYNNDRHDVIMEILFGHNMSHPILHLKRSWQQLLFDSKNCNESIQNVAENYILPAFFEVMATKGHCLSLSNGVIKITFWQVSFFRPDQSFFLHKLSRKIPKMDRNVYEREEMAKKQFIK